MSEDTQTLDPADAIITRRFELDDGHFDVHLWAPIAPKDDYARCYFQIAGWGNGKLRYSGGIDGVQALTSALTTISSLLYASTAWKEGRLTWEGLRNLGLPSLPGDRPIESGYAPAELLSLPGWQAVIRVADEPMPYLAWSDEALASQIRHLKAVLKDMDTSVDDARAFLIRIIDSLLEQKRYYEAVCEEAGLPPPPAGHDK